MIKKVYCDGLDTLNVIKCCKTMEIDRTRLRRYGMVWYGILEFTVPLDTI